MSYGVFGFANPFERDAEANGYILASLYDTKEEVDHVISQLHGSKIRAFKAHKSLKHSGFHIDEWALYIKQEDMIKLRPDYKPPEKPVKMPIRGGRRKDMAIKVIKMRKEDHMEWEDIAKELDRTVATVKDYFYRYNGKKSMDRLTDWPDERRPEGYDPETGLIRKENDEQTT